MRGRLEVISGPMFSGKTEELISRLRIAQGMGRMTKAYKPKIDGRYADDAIVSHKGNRFEAMPIESYTRIEADYEVIGLDEVQFYEPGVVAHLMKLVRKGVRVIASGLDLTYLGEPFGPMPTLLSLADHVQKLHATCTKCGSEACRSQRIARSNAEILVGGAEAYEPRCLSCFDPGGAM